MLKPSEVLLSHPMPASPVKAYGRCYDPDGSVKSICMYCFCTVAKVWTVDDLARYEATHWCEEKTRTA